MELVRPRKQKVWGWPTLANLFFGGMASSYYLLEVLDAFLYGDSNVYSQPAVFKLLAPALVVLGFLPTAIKVGRPLSGLQLLRNVRSSWISREILAAIIFIAAAVLDWMFAQQILLVLSITAAFALLVSQSFIVYRASAISAWNVPIMPILNLVSNLTTGYGLVLFMLIFDYFPINRGTLGIAASFLALDLILWLIYLCAFKNGSFREDTEALRRPVFLVVCVGVARLIPLSVLMVLIFADVALVSRIISLALALVGLVVIVGSAIQKFGIVLVAGYFKALVLGRQINNTSKYRVCIDDLLQPSSRRCKISN
jgi:DMSO reductase anchor subunit